MTLFLRSHFIFIRFNVKISLSDEKRGTNEENFNDKGKN